MERTNIMKLFISRIERRVRSLEPNDYEKVKDVLPVYNNPDFIKCRDYDVDKVNLAQMQKTNVVRKKIGLIAPSFKEEEEHDQHEFCDMV